MGIRELYIVFLLLVGNVLSQTALTDEELAQITWTELKGEGSVWSGRNGIFVFHLYRLLSFYCF